MSTRDLRELRPHSAGTTGSGQSFLAHPAKQPGARPVGPYLRPSWLAPVEI
ncbi:hypothetical protein ACFQ61_11485 [Streptomyces sp. NPDC056500]|uniref:hypothetical protein n=1 Tax=Streptomyces sp. NPDC056500 TaxID=3345840 RepID=UPI0036A72760